MRRPLSFTNRTTHGPSFRFLIFRLGRLITSASLAIGSSWTAQAAETQQSAAPAAAQARPRIGLVLSGGGARGLAHVGVLKVLEEARIPVDAISGTSMGAIIGGLYAAGLDARTLERELLALDWDRVFANRVPRESLNQRRREEDYDVSPAIEVGLERGRATPMLPLGSVSSRGLELLLRRYTLPIGGQTDFDALPIPFRAVATDMESGQPVVFSQGDLATALRASMSVPAVFPPTEVDGRILGDGGLVDNLPVDVVRTMGVDHVIAVNIGTPLARRDTLGTVLGLSAQMINILTEQNVQRSIAQLRPQQDLLLAPQLGDLTSGDFARARELMAAGERHAREMLPRLQAWALTPEQWQVWQARHHQDAARPTRIAALRFEGQDESHPERLAARLKSQPGQPFDERQAEKDTRLLAATGDYLHTDYRLERRVENNGSNNNGDSGNSDLVFMLQEKPWGPQYFRAGLLLSSDFSGRGDYAVKLSHNRHWLNASGAEWRNLLEIGSSPRWMTEWYQPLPDGSDAGTLSDWFVAAHASGERRRLNAYTQLAPDQDINDARVLGRYARTQLRLGADLGRRLGELGELRLGYRHEEQEIDPEFLAGASSATLTTQHARERALRAELVLDQLDAVSFPRAGYRLHATALAGRRWAGTALLADGTEYFHRLELDASSVHSRGRHTLDATLRLRYAVQQLIQGVGEYRLGGFQNLSGLEDGQLSGNRTLLGRLTYYARLNSQPVLTRGFFAGASLELGQAWNQGDRVRLGELRQAGSLFLGADTGLGPLYFGLTYAVKGKRPGLYLLLGRP